MSFNAGKTTNLAVGLIGGTNTGSYFPLVPDFPGLTDYSSIMPTGSISFGVVSGSGVGAGPAVPMNPPWANPQGAQIAPQQRYFSSFYNNQSFLINNLFSEVGFYVLLPPPPTIYNLEPTRWRKNYSYFRQRPRLPGD